MGHGKAAEKQPEKQPKQPKNSRKTVKTAVFRVFRLFFWLFFGCFTVTHSAPFSAVFRLFSMSGMWHLCRWPRRLQCDRNWETLQMKTFESAGSIHHVIFSGQNSARKTPTFITSHDVIEPLKQALLASRGVNNFCPNLQLEVAEVSHIGDGCWLPIEVRLKVQLCYESADHLKKCQSPDEEKCRKECFGKCRFETGCRGKCRKSAFAVRASAEDSTGADPEALFRHFPRHPVWNRHFPKHSFRHFSSSGLWHFFRWSALS